MNVIQIISCSKVFSRTIYDFAIKIINIRSHSLIFECYFEVHVQYWIRFKWNKHRCTYVHWRIYSSRDLDTLLHKVEVGSECIGKYTGLYTNATMEEKCENCSWMTIERVVLIELQWHEKLSLEWTNVWSVIPLFGMLIRPGGVNGNLHCLYAHQTAGETIECHSCN